MLALCLWRLARRPSPVAVPLLLRCLSRRFSLQAMASWGFFLLTGSIGFVACLTFVNKIYGAIKVD